MFTGRCGTYKPIESVDVPSVAVRFFSGVLEHERLEHLQCIGIVIVIVIVIAIAIAHKKQNTVRHAFLRRPI